MRAFSRSKIWLFSGVIFVLTAIVAECSLRTLGFFLLVPSHELNDIYPDNAKRIRILTLGESTTADIFSDHGKNAWPRLLETELRKAGVDARVYNEGLAGTNSAMLLSRTDEYIQKYHPQIVISMMGVNDHRDIRFTGVTNSKLISSLSQLRLLKVALWLGEWIDSQRHCKLDFSPTGNPKVFETAAFAFELSKRLSLSQVEHLLRKKTLDDHFVAEALMETGVKIIGDFSSKNGVLLATPYFDRAYDLYPLSAKIAHWELTANVWGENSRSSRGHKVSKELLSCGRNLPDNLLQLIAKSIVDDDELKRNPIFESRGLTVSKNAWIPIKYHYRALQEKLNDAGVTHIAMQYPTRPLDSLVSIFKDRSGNLEKQFANIVFVSNQENFEEALKHHSYEFIFKDRLWGSWGHTTEYGHRLIAEAAYRGVIDVLYPPAQRQNISSLNRSGTPFYRYFM